MVAKARKDGRYRNRFWNWAAFWKEMLKGKWWRGLFLLGGGPGWIQHQDGEIEVVNERCKDVCVELDGKKP